MDNPLSIFGAIAELRRRFRRYIIRRHGKIRAAWVFNKFRNQAHKKGYDKALIEDVIQKHKDEITEYQGTKYADQFLGTPSPLERDF